MAQSYDIRIEETVTETFPVTADSPEDAVSKARRLYYDGKLVLEPGTLIDLRISCTDTEPYVPEDFRGESYEQF